ncbi:hypothetical protein NMY22_g12055 [Coprinellus aureogranulatus]|nr:hypothetical protein NMY22_g12055 [Coprinellus aureogranulatus]
MRRCAWSCSASWMPVDARSLEVEITYIRRGQMPPEFLPLVDRSLDLREKPSLARLSLKMGYMDIMRVNAKWDALTELSLGPESSPIAVLAPYHTALIVAKATNLERLALEFTHGQISFGLLPPPAQPKVLLPKLKSLTIRGNGLPVSFVEFLSVPSITHLCVSPRPDFQPESEQTSALLASVQQYGHQLVDVSFNYQMVDSKTLLLVLQRIPNVEFLELSTFDHPIVLGDGFTLLDSTIAKLVTGRNSEVEDDGAETPLCGKMKKFRCNLHEATSEVKKDLINLVQSRRGGKGDKGSASWLEEAGGFPSLLARTVIMPAHPSSSDRIDLGANTSRQNDSPELSSMEVPSPSNEAMASIIILQSPFSQYLATNYAPSDEEIVVLRHLIGEYERELGLLTREIVEMENSSSIKITRRDAYLRVISQHKALLSSIRRVPTDILQEIFFPLQGLDPSSCGPYISNKTHPSIVVSQVCRDWRHIAHGSPQLWKIIRLKSPVYHGYFTKDVWQRKIGRLLKAIDLWTVHSGTSPISLYFKNGHDDLYARDMEAANSGYLQLVTALQQSQPRWSDIRLMLNVSWASKPLLRLLGSPSSNFARLERARVHTESSNLYPDSAALHKALFQAQRESSLLSAPSLRQLYLTGLWPDISLPSFTERLPPLTSLRLTIWDGSNGVNDQRLLRLLGSIHTLRHITFQDEMGVDIALPRDPPGYLFPALLSMSFYECSVPNNFASSCIAPCLRELRFNLGNCHRHEESHNLGFIECMHHFGSAVTNLTFAHDCVNHPSLITIFDCLPNLESLDLTPASFRGPRSLGGSRRGPDHIVLLELNGGASGSLRCPKLQALQLLVQDTYTRGSIMEEAAMLFLEERLNAAESGAATYLQDVNILFHRPTHDDRMNFGEELVKRGLHGRNLKVNLRYHG